MKELIYEYYNEILITRPKAGLDFSEPSEEELEYAKRELGEDPDTRCQVLEEFRDLIYERGECMPQRMDDAFLLKFLRAKYFVVRHAHRMLVSYYQFNETYPELFENVVMMELKKVSDVKMVLVPPYRDQHGRRMIYYRLGKYDPKLFPKEDVLRATFLVAEMAIMEEKTQIMGGVIIFDFQGVTTDHLWYGNPTLVKQVFLMFTQSFPFRTMAVHVVNQPQFFGTIFNLFKPLMTEQMRKKIFVHSNMESLHQHIDPQFLSKRYGGIHPDCTMDEWIRFSKGCNRVRTELKSLGFAIEREDLENNDDEEDY